MSGKKPGIAVLKMNLASMPTAVIIAVSMTAYLLCGIFRNYYSNTFITEKSGNYVYNGVTSVLCAATLAVIAGFRLNASLYTVLMAVFFGIATMAATVFTTMALKVGPWSYTSVIISFSTVITSLSGFIFWHEKLNALKITGIILMMFCFVLAVGKDDEEKSFSVKWLILAFAAAVATAGIGIMQKVHQSSEHSGELVPFLIIAFAVSFVFSVAAYKIETRRKAENKNVQFAAADDGNKTKSRKMRAVFVLILIISGICIALNNYFNLYLSGVVESAVLFPILNGGGLILNIMAGVLLFKERLTVKQWGGIMCGVAATICLCF